MYLFPFEGKAVISPWATLCQLANTKYSHDVWRSELEWIKTNENCVIGCRDLIAYGNRLYFLVALLLGVRRMCVIAEVAIVICSCLGVYNWFSYRGELSGSFTYCFSRGRGMILFLQRWVLIFIFKHRTIGRIEGVNEWFSYLCRMFS